jgi:SAM-dependent methyltransferase
MGGNSYLAKELKPLINKLGMDLKLITEHSDADIIWDRDTYLQDMAGFDIAICPQNVEIQPAKSAVKVTTAMGLGLPLICSPNPAYLEIVEHGINGYVASSKEDWTNCLVKLKSLELRRKFNKNALVSADAFTPAAIAKKWKQLLGEPYIKIALINNTLRQKYLSYGDYILDDLRLNGYSVEEFRYEDIDALPADYDLYLFVECRYDPEDINNIHPRVLITKEDTNLNVLPHYDLVVCLDKSLEQEWTSRGFVNIVNSSQVDIDFIFRCLNDDLIQKRKNHNFQIHSQNIESFYKLQLPENRWGTSRDLAHINFTMQETRQNDEVLDIGSADGWLSVYLAKENRQVSALEFVERGMEWTNVQANRLGVTIDLRKGFIEEVAQVFPNKKFNCILAYEILEHLDYLKLPWYLIKMESLLKEGGKILISLPKQDLAENKEHLWSPSSKLINKVFSAKKGYECKWVGIPDHGVPGNWFIKYIKE